MLHKSDTADLFQETSPNPIKWAFLDELSSESCISREKALKLTCPSVMSKWAFLVSEYDIFGIGPEPSAAHTVKRTSLYGFDRTLERRDHIMSCCHAAVLIAHHRHMPLPGRHTRLRRLCPFSKVSDYKNQISITITCFWKHRLCAADPACRIE